MGGAIQVKFLESNLDGRSFIEEELGHATQKIKIWDPYLSARTLRFIKGSVNKEPGSHRNFVIFTKNC